MTGPILIILGWIAMVGLSLWFCIHAPEGWEDETGFSLSIPPEDRED